MRALTHTHMVRGRSKPTEARTLPRLDCSNLGKPFKLKTNKLVLDSFIKYIFDHIFNEFKKNKNIKCLIIHIIINVP